MKDHVKIANAIDLRNNKRDKERIKLLQDELLYPKGLSFPLTLQFELTRNCNVRCRHCYNRSGIQSFHDRMQPENWINLAHYIVSKGGIFECILSGGEPLLLGNYLFDLLDILHDDGCSFMIISNGMLMDEQAVIKLKKYDFICVQISIDGYDPETHDAFRGVKGSWQKAVDAAYFVTKHGLPLTVAHSATPDSMADVGKMCNLAYQLGAGRIILGEISPSGRAIDNNDILMSYDQRNALYERINALQQKYAGRMSVERSASTKIQLMRYRESLNSGAIIRPNGDIRLDCMTPFIIGNVLDDDLYEIWNKKSASCWDDPRVVDYIDHMDMQTGYSTSLNYTDNDILI